jgi:hypothetical protein
MKDRDDNKRTKYRPGFPFELRVDLDAEIREGLDRMKTMSDRPIATYVRKAIRKALVAEGYITPAQDSQQ